MSVRLGPRDIVSLIILSEHYGAPVDVIAEMHGVSLRSARKMAERWRKARMVGPSGCSPVGGPSWVVPTAVTAESFLGFTVRHWAPTPKMADHVTTVLRLRLALVGLDTDRWISERQLRHEVGPTKPGVTRPHIHDGRFLTTAGDWWAVEVELSAKTSRAVAAASLRSAYRAAEAAGCAGLTYFCRGERVKGIIREAAKGVELSSQTSLTMRDLDKVLSERPRANATKSTRPSLRLVVGGTDRPTSDDDWTRP